MRNGSESARFAERQVHGVGEDGGRELITIWIERRPGAVWAVGRAIDLEQRPDGAVRPDDVVFEGYEMGDALEAANDALSSDLEISRGDGHPQDVQPFHEQELLEPLERWFFGRAPR
jgi:hypothetical protein